LRCQPQGLSIRGLNGIKHNPLHPRPPGPSARLDLEQADDKFQRIHALWQQYGDCFRVRAASRDADTWVITDPEGVRRVLVSNHRNYRKGLGIDRVRLLLGNGLMASEGEQWRHQRRLMHKAFHKPGVEAHFGAIYGQTKRLVGRCLRAAADDRAINLTEAVSECALMTILQALFSDDLDNLISGQGAAVLALVSRDSRRDLQFAVRFRALGQPLQRLIDERRRQRRFPADLLSHCLLAGEKTGHATMTDRQVIDEVLTLIIAGHETTAAALNWVWFLLASHPESFREVHNSLRRFDAERVPDRQTLTSLRSVSQVIKEALRLYPPGWLYTRRAVREDALAGFRLPAGSDVFICSWLLHRHPRYWDRPDEFVPARFDPAQEAVRHPYVYVPFSAGPRHCIGESFAMAEMMVHLALMAKVLQPHAIEPTAVALHADINLRPQKPLHLKFSSLVNRRA